MTEAAEPQWDERATLADRMRHYAVPGVGVAAIDNFAIDWSRGYGTLRAGGDESVTPETLFHAGSIAKCLSAAATLTLVEDGRLGLDRDIAEDLRSWQIPESDFTREEKVTLRRLLSHTGGLEDGFTNRSSGDPVPDYFTAEGSASSVSLVELLEPLGLPSSTYEQPIPSAQRPRAAVEHDLSGRPIGGDRLHIPFRAAGGLWTTLSDLAAFVIEILQAHRGESERILSQSITEEMLKRQIEIENNPVAEAAGIGFQLGGAGGDFYLVHTGGTWGSTAILWAYPERGREPSS
ncbi:MAG: beta-lactamase family protein [bacterium]|nr:beta-lactamase family protein [bacterium]